jgi:hypothetical protein
MIIAIERSWKEVLMWLGQGLKRWKGRLEDCLRNILVRNCNFVHLLIICLDIVDNLDTLESKIDNLEQQDTQVTPEQQEELTLLKEKVKKIEIDLENFPVKKIFLDVYPEGSSALKARVMMIDPRILEIDSLNLFFDVFKKEIKDVRENYEFKE